MRHLPERVLARAVVLLPIALAVLLPAARMAAADTLRPQPAEWTLSKPFEKDADARKNISGAACATSSPRLGSCLVVNDEKKYAQFFSIGGTTIRPGQVIRLLAKDVDGDPDAEAAAYDNGYFYVAGSHGRKRHDPKDHNWTSYVVFRIPVDKASGEPAFEVSDKKVVGVEASRRLRKAIEDKLHGFYDEPLKENGANIEGMAVTGGRMYLGFRGPSDHGNAFILSVDAAAVFTAGAPLDAELKTVGLGPNTGIRDMAAVSGGLLLLTGPVNKQKIAPSVVLWNPQSGALGTAHILEIADAKAKAETLLVLDDSNGAPWRVLVMFDGPKDGAPAEFRVPR